MISNCSYTIRLFVYSKWAASPYRQLIINETNI